MSVLVPVPHYLDACGFALSLGELCLLLGFVSQHCFGSSGFFVVPYEFLDYLFLFCEKCHGHFDRGCIKSVDGLGLYGYFNNMNSSSPGKWNIFQFI